MELWLNDRIEGQMCSVKVVNVLHVEKSPYQEIAVVETENYGKALVLNGALQLTEKDEFFYHEMLVHVPMSVHPCPEKVLIIGGGDGGSLREVLKHKSVKRAVMVEIDERVVEICKEFFPTVSCGFSDPRAEVLYEDGVKFVEETEEKFDIVLVDSTDPYDFAEKLFSEEFFRNVYRILTEEGVCSSQTESPFIMGSLIRRVSSYLHSLFKHSAIYWTVVPTYPGGLWTFALGSKMRDPLSFRSLDGIKTRFYSPEVHKASLAGNISDIVEMKERI